MQKMLRHRNTGAMYLYNEYLARHPDIVVATDAEVAAFHGEEVEVEDVKPKAKAKAKPKAEVEEAIPAPPIPAPPAPPAPVQE